MLAALVFLLAVAATQASLLDSDNISITPPAISVTNGGDVTVFLAVGSTLRVQHVDPSGIPIGGVQVCSRAASTELHHALCFCVHHIAS
jgi:hypothetical protein